MKKSEKKKMIYWLKMWLINAVVIFLVWVFYPENLVLGNSFFSSFYALVISSLILTLILIQAVTLAKKINIRTNDRVKNTLYYSVVNILAIYLMSKYAKYTGIGISSFTIALFLGIVLGLIHGKLKLSKNIKT